MRRRSVIYALCGISGEHIFAKMSRYARPTLDIRFLRHHRGAYLLWHHRRLPMWRTNVVLQILHFACGSVYGDKERLRSGWNNGPRTNRICILLKDRPLQNIVVRGPLKKVGTTNKVILHYIEYQRVTKKLMFAVRIPVRGIKPSATTKVKNT